MRVLAVLLLIFIQLQGFSQTFEERETITEEFSQTTPEIVVTKIASDSTVFAELTLKSAYLESQEITPEIIGFSISGTDDKGEDLYLSEMINKHNIPQAVIEKLYDCEKCTYFFIDRVTIKWFNGTYTVKGHESGKLNP